MRILQLTFTYGNNFGAMLQAYALNKVLENMGNECFLLPFYEHPFELLPSKKGLKETFLAVSRRFKKRLYTDAWFRKFNQFLYRECKFIPYVNLSHLHTIEDDYDIFLVGSDQVWNVPTFHTEHCLLKWVSKKEKRYSYAASLGNYSIRMKNDPVLDAIADFEIVSFREKIDYDDACRNGLVCRLDLDPTFLLDASEWRKRLDSKYAFLSNSVCVFGYDKKSFDFAKAYAKRNGMRLVVANYFGNRVFPGIKIINPASPMDFVSIIAHAGCVVTHSYHVFIVSLNLNKQVFVTKPNASKSANRFDTVIQQFQLSERDTEIENLGSCIDWERFNQRLAELRENSIGYLKEITGNG